MSDEPTILALDPSMKATGAAVFQLRDGRWTLRHARLLKTEKSKRKIPAAVDRIQRIQRIVRELNEMQRRFKFRLVVAEITPGGAKSATAMASLAISAAIVACFTETHQIPLESVTPTEVKVALCGKKSASKTECVAAVSSIFPKIAGEWVNAKGAHKGKLKNEFEHVADAIGAFMHARDGQMVKMLRRGRE